MDAGGQASVARYTTTAVLLHWIVAALILTGAALGLSMVGLPLSPRKLQWYAYHKWIGVTVFMLTAVRLVWRFAHSVPPMPDAMPAWQRHVANATHLLLYILMLVSPIIGWLHSSATGVPVVYFGVMQMPDLVDKNKELGELLRILHRNFNYFLLLLIGLHAAAALKHHYSDRDDVLARMLPFLKARSRI